MGRFFPRVQLRDLFHSRPELLEGFTLPRYHPPTTLPLPHLACLPQRPAQLGHNLGAENRAGALQLVRDVPQLDVVRLGGVVNVLQDPIHLPHLLLRRCEVELDEL